MVDIIGALYDMEGISKVFAEIVIQTSCLEKSSEIRIKSVKVITHYMAYARYVQSCLTSEKKSVSVVPVQGSAKERAEEIFFALDFNKVVVADDCPKKSIF